MSDDGASVAAVEYRAVGPGRLHIYTSVNGRWKHQMHNTCVEPRGLCVDDDDNILVADVDSKSVLLHDPRGQFLKNLVDVNNPYRVALYIDTYLAVGGEKLRLYQL